MYAASYERPEFLSASALSVEDTLKLLSDARGALHSLPNIEDVIVNESGAAHVVGDLHGHLHDLLSIIETFGWPSENCKYVFDGDFLDRGAWGVEVLLVLFVLKMHWPKCVFLLRGNHEYRHMMATYGFKQEPIAKYDEEVFELRQCFGVVSLGAVISTFVKCSEELEDACDSG